MKPKLSIVFILIVSNIFIASAQTNDFKIGMFGVEFKVHEVNGCQVVYEAPLDSGFKTSTLNVFKEDGFNIINKYVPNVWTSIAVVQSLIKLTGNNGMQIELSPGINYRPILDEEGNYTGTGYNDYDNCNTSYPICLTPYEYNNPNPPYYYDYYLHNIFDIFTNICIQDEYKDIIWGHHLGEEASYLHPKLVNENCQAKADIDFRGTEIPPSNIKEGMDLYKSILSNAGITHQKMVIMEANHRATINYNYNDQEWQTSTNSWGQNQPIDYDPFEYIELLDKSDTRDVFFEGSYFTWEPIAWAIESYSQIAEGGKHYLGFLGSIDFAKEHANSVHNILMAYYDNGSLESPLHTDVYIPNANYLWLQAYASIIHGVDGIWFWWLPGLWETETNEIQNISNAEDPSVWANPNTIEDRFDRKYFPRRYRYYLSNLARELNYLSQKGFLDKNTSVIHTKTDHADVNGIVPEYPDYINDSKIPAPFYAQLNHPLMHTFNDHFSENYGLRYTIRTNGDETILIIANMLPVPILDVDLDFSQIGDPQIQNAIGVEVLFETNQDVTGQDYKIVDSLVNYRETVDNTGKLLHYYYKLLTADKGLSLSFGPLDVHVLKFVSYSPHNEILVYPNPAYNGISILVPGKPECTIEIFDITGKSILLINSNENQIFIDCSGISSGIYILKIETSEEVHQQKIVIQK
ncbi:MAG: T9SS type A sorting domain-containing protein [Bacteroidales bacterium]|nr:T9SS type A sorting domain-containing protein [Bacteroidales bacterium]MCF8455626.1 T9SS type A sorting domain-containing protein [Bacteroidales bacterium]